MTRYSYAMTIMASALALAGCRATQSVSAAPELPPARANIETVKAASFTATVPFTGTLVSNGLVEVKAEVVGRITRFEKKEGDAVAAGEPIAWVNDENYRLSLRQAETAVTVAEAALERTRLLESHSQSELERAQNLLKSGGITDRDLKASELAERDARAQASVAAAQLEQTRAALALARKHMRDTVIQSPVSGTIQKKFVNSGAYVEAPTPVFSVVDNTRLELESPVAAADLAAIHAGQRVTFAINSYPGALFEGRVAEIAPAVDPETRSAKVRIQVANPGSKLKAGMFAEGEILTAAASQAIVIPGAAIYRDDRLAKSAYVFVAENGKAVRRAIRIGHERNGRVEILEGLKAGDSLIAEQSIEIADGVRVEAGR